MDLRGDKNKKSPRRADRPNLKRVNSSDAVSSANKKIAQDSDALRDEESSLDSYQSVNLSSQDRRLEFLHSFPRKTISN